MSKNGVRPTKRFSRWLRQRLLHRVTPEGFTTMNQFSPQDIFVAGYPKSGNTWFQTLLAGAVYGVLPEVLPMSMLLDLVPDVHSTRWYKRHSTPMFFKTHHLPLPEYRRVIYLLRDGRDAMVSYWHYRQVTEKRRFSFQQFLNDDRLLFPCKWHEHVKAWSKNPHRAKMLLVRYEDLKSDPVAELRRVCDFAGLDRSEEVLQRAADGATFDKMQAKEVACGPFNASWPRGELFCRRGKIGSYRDEMPGEVLEQFTQESRSALREYGYC